MSQPIATLCPLRPRYKPEVKLLCGEHPVFVDNYAGHHPMYTSPVPYAGEDDPTVAFLPVIVGGVAAA